MVIVPREKFPIPEQRAPIGMIEFMICSLCLDSMDSIGFRKAMGTDTPEGIARNCSVADSSQIRALWVSFMVDGYRDSLLSPAPERHDNNGPE